MESSRSYFKIIPVRSERRIDMSESNDELTPIDRVRQQLDRILSRNEQPDPQRQQQIELRAEVERMLVEHDRRHSSIERAGQNDDALAEQLSVGVASRNIILRLTEIKGLLERQEQIYREKERARERRNRAINEYIVMGFFWLIGAVTMLIWLRF